MISSPRHPEQKTEKSDPDPSTATQGDRRHRELQRERDIVIAALCKSENRKAFLLEFNDALRAQPDEQSIKDLAVKMLAEYLRLDRCWISEVFEQQGISTVGPEHARPDFSPMSGVFRLSDYPETMRQLVTERMIVHDAANDPRFSDSEKEMLAGFDLQALLVVPLRKGRRHVIWALAATMATPRDWTNGERALLEDVAERTWAAVERARAEDALRQSEEKYRTLFESIDEGVCTLELILDESGKCIDFINTEHNSALTRLTGFTEVEGKRASDVVPDLERFWFELYGRVARTGKPERVEQQVKSISRWFDIYVSRVGGNGSRKIVVVYSNITERKRAEFNAAFLDKISQDLVRLSKPDEILPSVGTQLGDYLGVSGCVFGDVDEERGEVTVHYGWTKPGVPCLKQTYRIDDYLTNDFIRANRAGETFVVRDCARDPRVNAERYSKLQIAAFAVAPFHWSGRWTGYVAATSTTPRDWRDDEIRLLKEVSERFFFRFERARAEEALRHGEQRLQVLVAELQHRTRNLIAVVSALAEKTRQESASLDDFQSRFDARLGAVARVQSLLSRTGKGDKVTFEALLRTELTALGVIDGHGERVTLDGPAGIRLRSGTVQTFALALHELATNAIKYGALSGPSGKLEVRWRLAAAPRPQLEVQWRESGVVMPDADALPRGGGYGRELIERALPYQLEATTHYEMGPDGVCCSIAVPVSEALVIEETPDA